MLCFITMYMTYGKLKKKQCSTRIYETERTVQRYFPYILMYISCELLHYVFYIPRTYVIALYYTIHTQKKSEKYIWAKL